MWISPLLLLVLFVVLLLLVLLPFVVIGFVSKRKDESRLLPAARTLLVIAHPDDECLFFAPTLLSSTSEIYLLCLSNGGSVRAAELVRSCEKLGVRDVRIVDDEIHLKDSQTTFWRPEAILGHVEQSIRRWNISQLISFDAHGVSGHRNHSSIYFALLRLRSNGTLRFFALISKSLGRKYLTLVEMFRQTFFPGRAATRIHFLPVEQRLTAHRAMFEHRSQLVWFRYLYLFFSQYIWINEFEQIF